MKTDIIINSITQAAFLTLQCHAIDAQSINPILSDFSSLKTLKIIRSNLEDHKNKLYKKLKNSKVKKNLVKITGLRVSKRDLYMKKFQPKGTCQCKVRDARNLKPVRSDSSLLKTFKLFWKLKTIKVKMQLPVTLSVSGR